MSTQIAKAVQFFNVDQFGRATYRMVGNVGKFVPCYYYTFNYQGTLAGVTMRCSPGAQHGEDLSYLFITSERVPTVYDYFIVRRITTLWCNFITTGRPTPGPISDLLPVEWSPVSIINPPVMQIDLNMGFISPPYSNFYSFYGAEIFSLGPSSTTY
ncbi:uncharacterized protein LOC126889343 [Diabrotica virgifera virgifera]|uniref:Carboxylesterase type B domain-containing protein n=1 Tax=Diabrotica virgifera virgifera TaxID=50390 RepID=A0ABM5KTL5_DIAVI|nr:uncharacterized protein LOC126889343 [Diabrotica virgifera virgifera]